MILLTIFAFLAGVVTILSPCILPVLPIVLSSSFGNQQKNISRPLGVVLGFIFSFTFFTLFLSTIVKFIGIPGDSLRFISIIIIALFGTSLLIPKFQVYIERLFTLLTNFAPKTKTNTGFIAGFIIGLSLGLLWTPCVGPILASVISLAITGTVSLDASIITLAYSIGTAIPMFIIIFGGQHVLQKVPWLLTNTIKIQKAFGAIMILISISILFNVDRSFQTYILNTFPQYGTGLTKFEENNSVTEQLNKITGKKNNNAPSIKNGDVGKPMFDLLQTKGIMTPDIIPGGVWFNLPTGQAGSGPLTLEKLRGKVVVIDFWTYTCINCQRTLPYLKKWYAAYKDKGLVIIGVHSPEFEFEKDKENVQKAISDFGITYPVVQDNNFETWRAYSNNYWPAKYFIDKDGYIRYTHFGEGSYDESEKVIQELLKETGAKNVSNKIDNPTYQNYSQTQETYLGYYRIGNFGSAEQINQDTVSFYTIPNILPDDTVAYGGNWGIMREYANPQKGSILKFNFAAKEVYLVMRPKSSPGKVKVFLDEKQQFLGYDVKNGIVTVNEDRLYKLIKLVNPGRHILKLEFEDNNTELYAFTFG